MKKIFCFLLLLITISSGAQVFFLPQDDNTSALMNLYLQSGIVFPINYFPIPKLDLARLADNLAATVTDEKMLNEIQQYTIGLGMRDVIYCGVKLTAAVEYNLYTDKGWEDFERLYWRNEPVSSILMYLQKDASFGLGIEVKLFRVYEGDMPTNIPLPEPSEPLPIENHFITKGYLWYNFDPLQVEIGRDQVHEGPLRDALGLSSKLPFLDMMHVRMPIGSFDLDWIVSTPETRTSGGLGKDVDHMTLLTMHRMEYAFETVKIGVEELNVFYRPSGAYFLGDMFPVFNFHQADKIGRAHV
jgi:hypothetical protein